MIEVEKKFRPTKEQLENLLKDCIFIKEVVNHDIYFDYPDYRLFKKEIRLRERNGNYELKIGDDEVAGIAEEIEDEEDLKSYLKIEVPLKEFIKDNLIKIIEYTTKRIKYKKDKFAIDVDDLSFGFKCVEIELMVSDNSETDEAHNKIINFAQHYGFEIRDVPSKGEEYFRLFKPDIHRKLYGDK
ncbi:MAG: CYTH domain-containing protein [Candidatus Pacebacteria bacterium]|nr:CYTH domain-containing protein [Candidatus Paceibacterota bacterium]